MWSCGRRTRDMGSALLLPLLLLVQLLVLLSADGTCLLPALPERRPTRTRTSGGLAPVCGSRGSAHQPWTELFSLLFFSLFFLFFSLSLFFFKSRSAKVAGKLGHLCSCSVAVRLLSCWVVLGRTEELVRRVCSKISGLHGCRRCCSVSGVNFQLPNIFTGKPSQMDSTLL